MTSLREDQLEREAEPIARKAARWVADHLDTLRDADPEVPAGLDDRAADNWRPLLAIADTIGGEWPGLARVAAVKLSGRGDDDRASTGTRLLADIRELFGIRAVHVLYSESIVGHLTLMENRPWAEYRAGRPMTKNQLAQALAPFNIHPVKVREPGGESLQGYRLADFTDAFARYLGQTEPPFRDAEECSVSAPANRNTSSSSSDTELGSGVPAVPAVPASWRVEDGEAGDAYEESEAA